MTVPSDVGECMGTLRVRRWCFQSVPYPTVAVRTKHCVIRRHIAVFFLGEFVELKRVFVVCLRLQFQESLGGVFNERFASLDAVV